jgi:hypothetical protein
MMNLEGYGMKLSWPVLGQYFSICLGGTEKNYETPQGSQFLGQNLNTGPHEYEL